MFYRFAPDTFCGVFLTFRPGQLATLLCFCFTFCPRQRFFFFSLCVCGSSFPCFNSGVVGGATPSARACTSTGLGTTRPGGRAASDPRANAAWRHATQRRETMCRCWKSEASGRESGGAGNFPYFFGAQTPTKSNAELRWTNGIWRVAGLFLVSPCRVCRPLGARVLGDW